MTRYSQCCLYLRCQGREERLNVLGTIDVRTQKFDCEAFETFVCSRINHQMVFKSHQQDMRISFN